MFKDSELDKYAKKHKLYIVNHSFKNEKYNHDYKDFLDDGVDYNGVLVKQGDKKIIEAYTKQQNGLIKDSSLLMMIKEEIRDIKLKSIL
jgi:hypothetical protein